MLNAIKRHLLAFAVLAAIGAATSAQSREWHSSSDRTFCAVWSEFVYEMARAAQRAVPLESQLATERNGLTPHMYEYVGEVLRIIYSHALRPDVARAWFTETCEALTHLQVRQLDDREEPIGLSEYRRSGTD